MKHQAADALSRLRTLIEDTTLLADSLSLLAIDTKDENSSHIAVFCKSSDEIILLEAQPDALLIKYPLGEEFGTENSLENKDKSLSSQVGQPNTEFLLDDRGLYVRKSIVAEAIIIVVPESLRIRIFYILHFLKIAADPGQQKTFETLRSS